MTECERIVKKGVLSLSFFEEEKRCEFLVTKKRKEIWAVQLDLLQEFQRVCNAYGLKYMACGGTILGAARHEGFIPWDDDIDVMMPRKEYNRFCQIAPREFKHPYFFQTEETDPGYLIRHVKIRNSNTAEFSMGFSKYGDGCRFNQGIFIDVFPLDNVPDNMDERNSFFSQLWESWGKLWKQSVYANRGLRFSNDENRLQEERILRDKIEGKYLLYEEYEKLSAKYMDIPTQETYIIVCCRNPENSNDRYAWLNNDLQETILMPFEMLQVPVPKNYDNVLRKTYGNWNEFVMGGSLHSTFEDTLYDTEHSYKEYLIGGALHDLLVDFWNRKADKL